MKITEKINLDYNGLIEYGAINIVIFGDSVSHGCFDIDEIDYESVYWNLLRKKINGVRDYVPVNMINSAIGGITAKASLERMERDVLSHNPDLVIVCFGLNDVNGELDDYINPLKSIFNSCVSNGTDVVFMTPNMLNTYVADDTNKNYTDYAALTASVQNSGRMDKYMQEAKKAALECGVTVCDCYSEWKRLSEQGADITMLLENRINHPTREMHKLFADMLFKTIFGENSLETADTESTMYREK